jgi:hypothetical protein
VGVSCVCVCVRVRVHAVVWNAPMPSGACWTRMGWSASQAVAVRDTVAHTNNGTVTGGISVTLRPNATALLKLTPA